jgi:hypothetical protein
VPQVDRDAVGDDDAVDVGLADLLERLVGEERVRDEDVDLLRALLLQRPRAGDERAAGEPGSATKAGHRGIRLRNILTDVHEILRDEHVRVVS